MAIINVIGSQLPGTIDLSQFPLRYTGPVDVGDILPPAPPLPPPPDPYAGRTDVTANGGTLGSALTLGVPLYVPPGEHILPANFDLTGVLDIMCHPDAHVILSGSNFIRGGPGALIWTGGNIHGDGNDYLVVLNSAVQLPAIIDIRDANLFGCAEINWGEWTIEGNGRIGRVAFKNIVFDGEGTACGTNISNGVIQVDVENYEARNFRRFGIAILVHGNYPSQQAGVEYAKYKNVRLTNGRGGGSSDTNSNAFYFGGRHVTAEDILVDTFHPPIVNGIPDFSQDGDEGGYLKAIYADLKRLTFRNCTSGLTLKGQSWGNLNGSGPIGAGYYVEDLKIEIDSAFPSEMPGSGSGVLDQSRYNYFNRVQTIGLRRQAYLSHQTNGPVTLREWHDSGRDVAAPWFDNGKGIFNNRSDLGALGALSILGSSVQPELAARATKTFGTPPSIIDAVTDNSWN